MFHLKLKLKRVFREIYKFTSDLLDQLLELFSAPAFHHLGQQFLKRFTFSFSIQIKFMEADKNLRNLFDQNRAKILCKDVRLIWNRDPSQMMPFLVYKSEWLKIEILWKFKSGMLRKVTFVTNGQSATNYGYHKISIALSYIIIR